MEPQDILYKTKGEVFSYRVAGILIREGKVLLQHPLNDPTYAFPGGHVNLGEVSEDALVREFKEEIAAEIQPERLVWIGENFFPWGKRSCHQICLYFLVTLSDETHIPLEGHFASRDGEIEFCWVDLAEMEGIQLYPTLLKEKLTNVSDRIELFLYVEE